MQPKTSRQLNEAYLDAEDELTRLTSLTQNFEFVHNDFHKFLSGEWEILEKIQRISKGTEAERSTNRQLDELEKQRRTFTTKLTNGEEYLEELVQNQRKKRNQLEEDLFQVRKEENQCQK